MTGEPLPSLKLLAIDPASPVSLAAVRRVLVERIGDSEVRELYTYGLIVNTELEPSGVRDLVAPALGDDQRALVVEFERWSDRGGAVDATWLMRRGH